MKIQCNVCEVAEANVLCCADEAALCWDCDEKVHSANKIVSKHQRVPLSSSLTQIPKCDICRDMTGYFFCLEDRALLCRKCDVAIHTANSLVSVHQRFLLTGIKVDLESTETAPATPAAKTPPNQDISEPKFPQPKSNIQVPSTAQPSKLLPVQASLCGNFPSSRLPLAGGSATGNISSWQLDEFLGFGDFNENYFTDNDSSKADSGKLGDSDCSPTLRVADGEVMGDECMELAPDASWVVPQIPSPPTASGLSYTKNYQGPSNSPEFMPAISSSTLHDCYRHHHAHRSSFKWRRRLR